MEWYYVDQNNEQKGPFDEDDMAANIAGGIVAGETLVWKEGLPDWIPARTAPEFSMLFQDHGEQATMIGGMTFAQGGYHTDVRPPAYAVRSEHAEPDGIGSSDSNKSAETDAGTLGTRPSKIGRLLKWLKSKLGL